MVMVVAIRSECKVLVDGNWISKKADANSIIWLNLLCNNSN
jgi:hypothetical protein